jgi:hypothetical protein
MKHKSVLLDTSFFIRLLNDEDPLHKNAKGYYKYFLENEIVLKVSTISIAEYCVGGELDDLPLRNIQIVPFNLDQAVKTGEFAKVIFDENKVLKERLTPRAIIPNDAKLFSQADLDETISHFVTSDIRSKKTLKALKKGTHPRFEIIEISIPYNLTYGILDLE